MKGKNSLNQRGLFDVVTDQDSPQSKEMVDYLRALNSIQRDVVNERIINAAPPGTILETVICNFKKYSDIPLEIPYFTLLHFLSAVLLQKNVKILFAGNCIYCDIWTVILAPSGSSKTLGHNFVKKCVGAEPYIYDMAASAAQFIIDMKTKNKMLLYKDEWGQVLKNMRELPHMQELKGYFLKLYDNDPLSRNSKKDQTTIPDPAMSILGMNATETFFDCVTFEDLMDGFAQRFCYVLSKKDPQRPMTKYPVYSFKKLTAGVNRQWMKAVSGIQHPQYDVSRAALISFKKSFETLIDAYPVPESFYRRIMFRSIKYSLLFHIICGKGRIKSIDKEDMAFSAKAILIHLEDARELLDQKDKGRLRHVLECVERVYARFIATKGVCTLSDIVRNVRDVKSVAEVRALVGLMPDDEARLCIAK